MALKTDTMNALIVSLLLQTVWAQPAAPWDLLRLLNHLGQQEADDFSESGQFNFNYPDAFPLPYENIADPQLDYQHAAEQLPRTQNDFYNIGSRDYPVLFLPINTLRLRPDRSLFLSFCNWQPIQIPTCCNHVMNPSRPEVSLTEVPSTTSPSTISPPPLYDQSSTPVSVSTTSPPSSPPSQTSSTRPNPPRPTRPPTTRPTTKATTQQTSSAATSPTISNWAATPPSSPPSQTSSTRPNLPPSTRSPTTRPTTKTTTQQTSSAATSPTEDPAIITQRIGDIDEVDSITEEQYLPINFVAATPDPARNVTAPPVRHVLAK